MTDEERDQIDKDVLDFVKLCTDVIKILRVETRSKSSTQQYEHQNNAIDLAETYIKRINEIHNRNKALRLRKNLDSQNFFRLNRSAVENKRKTLDLSKTFKETMDFRHESLDSNDKNTKPSNNDYTSEDRRPKNSNKTRNYTEYQDQSFLQDLTQEEIKLFKQEGDKIYDQMNSMNEEVQNIAKKLTEISQLQSVFTEKIVKQESDLSQLNSSTIMSTEYIREGNEQLREAMRKNAGFRVWILFFIAILAFVVLFLDWYNP
ncbi:hypothetical protein QR98_0092880 [Sarcoptes scabiei]|uniref:Syntaxin-18 n=1 Tax=Sarcoptes scabiei TaxID=52283 RepID=A0A132AIG3_SARSC|nr:hypothetical protein QR98_0092880 [Sarcoptes scabiei]